jgi:hypothetical protein
MYWDNQFEKGNFPKTDKEFNAIQTHSTHSTLKEAKKVCRGLGHTEENNRFLTGYPPVAYVSDGEGVVYTPRFKK